MRVTLTFVITAFVVAPAAAHAQVTVYTDLASFLSATSTAGTDTFDDLAPTPASPLGRTAGPFAYTATASTTGFFAAGTPGDRWLSTNTATDVITFSGFAPSVRGVGAILFGTDLDGLFRAGTSLTVRATNATGTVTRTLTDPTTATFLGFVSTSPFVSVTLEVATQPTALAWPTVNNLVLASAAPAAVVPEPATVVLLGVGAVGTALVARTRRRV